MGLISSVILLKVDLGRIAVYQPSLCELRLGEADLAIYAGTRR
jgi:hypothetical protein